MKTFVPSLIFPSQYIYNKIRWNETVLSFKNHCPNTVTIVHKFKRLHSCKLYYSLSFTVVSFVHFCTSVFQALRRRYGDTSLQAEAAVRFLQDMIPTVSLINKDLHVYSYFEKGCRKKVHATILKGIVGDFKCTVFQGNLKESYGRPLIYVCEC